MIQGMVRVVTTTTQGGVGVDWTATTVAMDNAADFPRDGGQFTLEGAPELVYTYEHVTEGAYEGDPDILGGVVPAPAVASGTDEFRVDVYPPAVHSVAEVAFPDAVDDTLPATIGHDLKPYLVDGVRDQDAQESVLVEIRGTEWVVSELLDQPEVRLPDVVDAVQEAQAQAQQAVGDAGAALTGLAEAVKDSVIEYAVAPTETTPPAEDSPDWSTTTPVHAPGTYLWMRTRITRGNDEVLYSAPAPITGNAGAPGSAGRSIDTIDVWYYLSTSATALVGGTWTTTAPAWVDGRYMWSKTIVTYTEGAPDESAPVNITGAQGQTGDDGKGITGTVSTYQAASSGTTTPTGTWTPNPPAAAPGQYVWTRTVTTYTDATTSTAYAVGRIGSDGVAGDDGKGIVGTAAVDYQLSSAGTVPPTGSWVASPVPAQTVALPFLWTRTTTTYTDATSSVTYSVSRRGDDGTTGGTGRGVASIVEEYYSSTSSTTQTGGSWVTSPPAWVEGRFYWTRSLITYTSGTPTTTTTTPIMVSGAQGSTGAPGRGIDSTVVTYQASSSGTTVPTGTWVPDPPAAAPGQYVWTRTVITYTSGSPATTTSYSVGRIGTNGTDGDPGAPGRGIVSTAVAYQLSASGVTAPTGTWVGAPPVQTVALPFLWTRTVATYTDATTTTAYSVARRGDTGSQGVSITSVVAYFRLLAAGSSAPATPTGATPAGWTTTEPAYVAGQELWRSERINYSNGTITYTTPQKSSAYAAAVYVANLAEAATQGLVKIQQGDPGHYPGRIWYQTNSSNQGIGIKVSVSGAWVPYMLMADQVLVPSSVGSVLIANGEVIAQALNAKEVTALTILSGIFQTHAAANKGAKLGPGGLAFYLEDTSLGAFFSGSGITIPQLFFGAGVASISGYNGGDSIRLESGRDLFTESRAITRMESNSHRLELVRRGVGALDPDETMTLELGWSGLKLNGESITGGTTGWTAWPRGLSTYTSTAEYRKVNGVAYFRGSISINSGNMLDSWVQALAALPTGFRPEAQRYLPLTTDGLVTGRISIASSGTTSIRAMGGSVSRLDLETLTPYPVAA